MKTDCPRCSYPLAKVDRRRREGGRLVVMTGVTLEQSPDQAPRLRCPRCGTVIILVEGRP